MNPALLSQALTYAPHVKQAVGAVGGLRGLGYRIIGFGQAEAAVGVPKWAWFVLGVAAGAAGIWFARPRLEAWMER